MKISATLLVLAATFSSFTMAAPVIGKRGVTVVTVTSEVVDVINYTTTLYVDSMPVTSDVTTTSSSSYTSATANSTTSSSSTPSSTTVSTTSSSSSTSTTLSTSTKLSSTSTLPSSTSTSTTPAPTTSSSKSTSTPPPATTSSIVPSTTSTSTPPPAPTTTSTPPPPSSSASVAPAASSAAPSSASTGSSSGSSSSYQGEITFYDPSVGKGSCGEIIDGTVQKIVALPIAMFDAANVGTNPNNNPLCGKTITVQVGSSSVVATVTDACQGCTGYHIDLSSCAFDALAAETVGVVPATWWFN